MSGVKSRGSPAHHSYFMLWGRKAQRVHRRGRWKLGNLEVAGAASENGWTLQSTGGDVTRAKTYWSVCSQESRCSVVGRVSGSIGII